MAIIKVIQNNEGFMPDFTKDIHYISWTPYTSWEMRYKDGFVPYSGLSYTFAIVSDELGFDSAIPYFTTIDCYSETGTMFPKNNITLMPGGVYEDEQIYSHFGDAIKAQQLVKSHHVIFDMRFYVYTYPHSLEADNFEYYRMIDWNKHRFDFDDTGVTIYVLFSYDWEKYILGFEGITCASEKEILYLSK